MGKKSINFKEATRFVEESRKEGKTDQEVYDILVEKYFDKKAVALFVTSVVKPELKAKYRQLNNLLIFLISLILLSKVLSVISLRDFLTVWELLIVLVLSVFLSIYFIYAISKYQAVAYRLCGILFLASTVRELANGGLGGTAIVGLFLGVAISVLAFYLDNKMFPSYSPNSMAPDANGDYVLP